MNKTLKLLIGMAAGISLAACGASGNGGTAPSNPAPLASNVLQFAVGTANLYGTSTGLNVVATYRQASGSYAPGDSGALLDSITLTVASALVANANTAPSGYDPLSTVLSGPAAGEVGGDVLTSSSQNPGTTTVTSFGQSGGVFGLGIEPFNSVGPGSAAGSGSPNTLGAPFQVAPYPIPLLDNLAGTDPNALIPWGGPPAFLLPGSSVSVVGNSNYPKGTAGVSEGIDVFAGVPATAGATYSLSVSVPANTGAVTQSKSFTLPAGVTIATPVNPAFAPDGSGGGTLAFTMPANATEAYVELVDYGAAGAKAAPVYYTLETNTSGTLTLPDNIGPGSAASVTAGDQLVVQVVAFDYPAFESSYPNSLKNPSPAIVGAAGSDDLAISAATCTLAGSATSCNASLPLLRKRELAAAYGRHILR